MKNAHIRRVFTLSPTAAREINRVAEEALNNADLTLADTRADLPLADTSAAIEAVLDKYWELGAADNTSTNTSTN